MVPPPRCLVAKLPENLEPSRVGGTFGLGVGGGGGGTETLRGGVWGDGGRRRLAGVNASVSRYRDRGWGGGGRWRQTRCLVGEDGALGSFALHGGLERLRAATVERDWTNGELRDE